jgi:hypothetical protein
MAELSADEKQSLDHALSTLDDLYEATLKPDGGFHSEQMEAIANGRRGDGLRVVRAGPGNV